ncbi:MAG: hypothetical protein HY690_01385 [Chloroflexi bacterium]|nr:hypothetical protein [Chloroflexota bacterium]
MRLELASFTVRDVRFSNRTGFNEGILSVDRDELRQLLLQSGDFDDVGVEIARPGEATRLIHVMDAAEPRFKPGNGSTFPGFLGPRKTVGEGRTHRLAEMAIVSVGEPAAGEPTYMREAIVDMAGPGAEVSPFGSTINLVLDFKPHQKYLDPDLPEATMHHIMIGSPLAQRYNHRVRAAELQAAAHLARTTEGMEPDSLEVHELGPVDPSLPRVVYYFQMNWIDVYGENTDGILPSLIHPNEILDGALVNVVSNHHASYRSCTFFNQNHALVRELCARHGTDLNFLGVIIYPGAVVNEFEQKDMLAEHAVKLARMLGVQGACSSYYGGGHPCVEFMLICQKCERAGITTVQVMPENYGTPDDPGFVYSVPEAVAIISAGRATQRIDLPAVPKVIGGQELWSIPGSPGDSLSIPHRLLYGCSTATGYGRLTARQY